MPRQYENHYLTEERKKLAEDNINLVWSYINQITNDGKIKEYERDDVTSYIMFKYCMACETFDSTRDIKFSTYAYAAFKSGLYRYKQLKLRFYSRFITTAYGHKKEDETISLEPIFDIKNRDIVLSHKMDDIIEMANLTTYENQIIYYKYHGGLTNLEIGKKLGYTGERIRQLGKSAIEKIKKYVEQNNYVYEDLVEEVGIDIYGKRYSC